MKTKLLITFFILFTLNHLFATSSLNATYYTDNVKISQFLCYYGNLKDNLIDYGEMENKFYQFYYLSESLLNISNKLEVQISFYSENDISQLDIGDNTYFFVTSGRENEVKNSVEEYLVTEDFNNSYFIIPYVCKDLKLQQPIIDFTNKNLYSLKIKNPTTKFNDEEFDNSYFFFLPEGEGQFVPSFKLKGYVYYGFYFSESEAKVIKRKLQENYCVSCIIEKLPCDFNLLNEAYFSLNKKKTGVIN